MNCIIVLIVWDGHWVLTETKVRGSYKDEINDNIVRLNQVSKELETLEAKANTFRDQISQQKANNTNQMMGTIAILTDVNNKMKKYSIIKRNRIIVEVNIVLGCWC